LHLGQASRHAPQQRDLRDIYFATVVLIIALFAQVIGGDKQDDGQTIFS
jgi:hypothetical protein